MVLKVLWLEIVMVRRSGDQVEFWLSVQEKDVAWSNEQVQGHGMCGSGDGWAWWTAG